jgi:hypothetical protein
VASDCPRVLFEVNSRNLKSLPPVDDPTSAPRESRRNSRSLIDLIGTALNALDAVLLAVLALPLLWWLCERYGAASPLVQTALIIVFVFLLALRIQYALVKRRRRK